MYNRTGVNNLVDAEQREDAMEPRVLIPKSYCLCQQRSKRRRRLHNTKNEMQSKQQECFALVLKNKTAWVLCRWYNHSWALMEEKSTLWFDETLLFAPHSQLEYSVQHVIDQVTKVDSGYAAWSLSCPPTSRQDEDISHAQVGGRVDVDSDSLSAQMLPAVLSFHCTPAHVLSLSVQILHNRSNLTNHKADSLLHSHLKRQLVGKVLPHSACDTLVKVKSLKLQLALRVISQASNSPFVKIVPSTRITIKTTANVTFANTRNQSNPSHVTKLLIHIIHCIKNQIPVPRTFLLSGNPGVGKTYSVKAAYSHCEKFVKLVSIRGSELLQKNGSNPARVLRLEFQQALSLTDESIVLLFLDECDALVNLDPVASALARMLDYTCRENGKLIVVGATNRVDSIPGWLRRAGRFDCEIPVLPPNAVQRHQVLLKLLQEKTRGLIHERDRVETLRISEILVGYVPADLTALLRRAIFLRHSKATKTPQTLISSHSIVDYLKDAMQDLRASSLRDAAFSKPPNTNWNDVVGDPGGAKTALRQAIEWPTQKKAAFEMLGLTPPRGVLLHGPPGCSKTTLAKAAAGATGVTFLSLNPAQVYASSFVGEAERIVRRSFMLARAAAPCILFFDEVDAIFGGENKSRGNSAEARVLSTFLNEMDGIESSTNADEAILVLGATNRPWSLDPALLRPGRLGDKIVFVPPPDHDARKMILQKQIPDENVIDFEAITIMCDTMTGAEIIGACQAAKIRQLRDILDHDNFTSRNEIDRKIDQAYIVDALKAVKPALSNSKTLDQFRSFGNDD